MNTKTLFSSILIVLFLFGCKPQARPDILFSLDPDELISNYKLFNEHLLAYKTTVDQIKAKYANEDNLLEKAKTKDKIAIQDLQDFKNIKFSMQEKWKLFASSHDYIDQIYDENVATPEEKQKHAAFETDYKIEDDKASAEIEILDNSF